MLVNSWVTTFGHSTSTFTLGGGRQQESASSGKVMIESRLWAKGMWYSYDVLLYDFVVLIVNRM